MWKCATQLCLQYFYLLLKFCIIFIDISGSMAFHQPSHKIIEIFYQSVVNRGINWFRSFVFAFWVLFLLNLLEMWTFIIIYRYLGFSKIVEVSIFYSCAFFSFCHYSINYTSIFIFFLLVQSFYLRHTLLHFL